MAAIKFTDKELEFLKDQYIEELANAEKYVDQVKEILKKLGVSLMDEKEDQNEKQTKKDRKKDHKHKEKHIEIKVPKKRGRKPKVVLDFIETTPTAEPTKELDTKSNEPKVQKKRGRPKLVVTPEVVPVAATNPIVKIDKKKTEPKLQEVEKVKVEKKPIVRRVPTPKPKVQAKTVVKKNPVQKQKPTVKGTQIKQNKPVVNKEVKVKPAIEVPANEPIIGSTEEPKA